MREELKALYELQRIDLDLARTQKAKAALDDGTAKRQRVETVRGRFQQTDTLYHEAAAEMQDKELNLKSVETKQKSYRDKLYGGAVSNPKELESMEKEVEMLGRQKDKLEERILELMDIIEERKAEVASVQEVLRQQESDLDAHTKKIRREAAALTA